MTARLKVLGPLGSGVRLLSLPTDRPLVIGRLPDCDLVVSGEGVARRHCQLEPEGAGHVLLRDLDSNAGAQLNGTSVSQHRLQHGDVIAVGATQLVFIDRPEAHQPDLEAAIARAPDQAGRWLVYADWLSERGDPIGERIARAGRGEPVAHADALEGLWAPWSRGAVELDWHYGFVRRAVVRAALPTLDWRSLLAQVLSLRVSAFLRELWVDLPSLEPWSAAGQQPFPVGRWVHELLTAPLPATLTRLCAGAYGPSPQTWPPVEQADPALVARHPALAGPFFRFVRGATLTPLELPSQLQLRGATVGRPLPVTQSLRFTARKQRLSIERFTSPEDTDLAVVELTDARWFAQPGAQQHGFWLNGVHVTATRPLIDGDLLEVAPGLRCRFALVD